MGIKWRGKGKGMEYGKGRKLGKEIRIWDEWKGKRKRAGAGDGKERVIKKEGNRK